MYMLRVLILGYLFLLTISCGHDGGDNNGTAGVCNPNDPQGSAVTELTQSNITKDTCQEDPPAAVAFGSQLDSQIQAGFLPWGTSAYDGLIARLKQQASISPSVPIRAVTSLQCIDNAGGGQTSANLVYIDGKFVDILSEYSTYLTMVQGGLTPIDRRTALNFIVNYHMQPAFQCANVPPVNFTRNSLSSAQQAQADSILDSLAGAILYHEYGHYWAHATTDMLILNFTPQSSLYYFPSKVEDDADFIAGILTKKTRHNLGLAQEMIDIMAFYWFRRNLGITDTANIQGSYQLQFVQTSQSYSSLARRKDLIAQGYGMTP